jgi:XTP/dITP diphosphohydrolase
MKLIFATHNINKAKEIQQAIGDAFTILSLADLNYHEDILETGKTLEENATIKCIHIWNTFRLPCFADDTGLEVQALNNAPGVYSARYAGAEKNDEANMQLLLKELQNASNRSARFKTIIAYTNNGQIHLFEGILNGKIAYEPKGNNGFGYDPVFIPENSNQTLAEYTLAEKNTISHRKRAFGNLSEYLKE